MTIDQNAIAKTRLDGLTSQAIRYVIATANALHLGPVDEAEHQDTDPQCDLCHAENEATGRSTG
jgi:hypothetical protein